MNKCNQVKYEYRLESIIVYVSRSLDMAQGLSHKPALQSQVVEKLKEIKALIKVERAALNTEGSEQYFLQGEKDDISKD